MMPKIFDKNKLFFTSDLHFNHKAIIGFCNRPYCDTKMMEEELINNWNKVVPEDGIVFILGDIGFTTIYQIETIFKRMNGTKYLVLGNHDERLYRKNTKRLESLFECVNNIMHIQINDGNEAWLSHFPILCYPGDQRDNVLQLHGHIHSGPGLMTNDIYVYERCKTNRQYDVGVDNNNYTPISYTQILEKLKML